MPYYFACRLSFILGVHRLKCVCYVEVAYVLPRTIYRISKQDKQVLDL